MPATLEQAVEALQREELALPPGTRAAIERNLGQYLGAVADNIAGDAVGALFDSIRGVLAGTETRATIRTALLQAIQPFGDPQSLADEINLDFKIDVPIQVLGGARQFIADQTTVDEFPAWEFLRVFERELPRGLKREGQGVIEVPDEAWPTRWAAAGAICGDSQWLPWQGDWRTGRGMALKSSRIWQALGDGAGGYSDTLGNPFPPFAFNSGFRRRGVDKEECYELGLLKRGEKAQPTPFDWSQLISLPEAA